MVFLHTLSFKSLKLRKIYYKIMAKRYYERIRRLISLVLLFVLCMHLMEIHRFVTEVIVLLKDLFDFSVGVC